MRDRCHVLDSRDAKPSRLQCTDRRLAAATRSANMYHNAAHSEVRDLARGSLGRHLRGKRRSLARPLESDRSRARPSYDQSIMIGDRHNRVVESRVDMHYPFGHHASRAPPPGGSRCCSPLTGRSRRTSLFFGLFCHRVSLAGPPPAATVLNRCRRSSLRGFYPLGGAAFLPATTLRGPLRVRAFVWVRCPRTGRLRRWRSPR